MRHHPLLLTLLAALGGCANPNGPLVDGEYCIEADPAAACPAAADVEEQLLGDHCDAIVEEVTGEGRHDVSQAQADTGGAAVDIDVCCYPTRQREQTGCVDGRPIRVDGAARVAPVVQVAGWGEARRVEAVLPAEIRAALADAWALAGAHEHASVAAFAKLVLELMAFGAPSELVLAAQQAMGDEIRHATSMFGLASAFAGAAVGPGALPIPAVVPRAASLSALVADTVREGCVGETIAAALIADCADHADDPGLRATLSAIAADESRHAALSWRIVQWAIAVGGAEVAAAADAAFADALAGELVVEAALEREDLRTFGRLGRARAALVAREARDRVIVPAMAVLRAA